MSEIETMKQNFYSDLAKELKPMDKESLMKVIGAVIVVTKAEQKRIEHSHFGIYNNGFYDALKKIKEETAKALSIIEINRVD